MLGIMGMRKGRMGVCEARRRVCEARRGVRACSVRAPKRAIMRAKGASAMGVKAPGPWGKKLLPLPLRTQKNRWGAGFAHAALCAFTKPREVPWGLSNGHTPSAGWLDAHPLPFLFRKPRFVICYVCVARGEIDFLLAISRWRVAVPTSGGPVPTSSDSTAKPPHAALLVLAGVRCGLLDGAAAGHCCSSPAPFSDGCHDS